MQVLGIDLGFGFTKATNGERELVIKSVIGESEALYAGRVSGIRNDAQHLHLEIEDSSLFVGELAERQSALRSFTLDQERFISEAAKPLALAVGSVLADPRQPIRLVTGLPISTFRDKGDELARTLKGRHSFVMVDSDGGRERITLDFAEVHVIPQPFGSLYNMVLGSDGTVSDPAIQNEKIGVVDVGFHTTDFTVSDKTTFIERASASTESGIGRAFSIIAAKLREKSGVSVEVYRLYEAMQSRRIKVRGNEYDLGRLVEHVLSQLATDLASEANRLWADEWDMDGIVITGGGGAVLAPYLAPLLSGRVLPMDETSDARLMNVRGYYRFGRYLWGRSTAVSEPTELEATELEPTTSSSNGYEPAAMASGGDHASVEDLDPLDVEVSRSPVHVAPY